MKYRLILCIVVAMMLCSQLAAQELMDIGTYDRKSIYLYQSIRGDGFVKNGEILPMGVFGSNLRREMSGSKYAVEEMQKARKYKIVGATTNLVAAGFGITGTIMALWGDNDNRTFEITSFVISVVCGTLSQGFNRASMGAMNRAVWLYNRDVMGGWLQD